MYPLGNSDVVLHRNAVGEHGEIRVVRHSDTELAGLKACVIAWARTNKGLLVFDVYWGQSAGWSMALEESFVSLV